MAAHGTGYQLLVPAAPARPLARRLRAAAARQARTRRGCARLGRCAPVRRPARAHGRDQRMLAHEDRPQPRWRERRRERDPALDGAPRKHEPSAPSTGTRSSALEPARPDDRRLDHKARRGARVQAVPLARSHRPAMSVRRGLPRLIRARTTPGRRPVAAVSPPEVRPRSCSTRDSHTCTPTWRARSAPVTASSSTIAPPKRRSCSSPPQAERSHVPALCRRLPP